MQRTKSSKEIKQEFQQRTRPGSMYAPLSVAFICLLVQLLFTTYVKHSSPHAVGHFIGGTIATIAVLISEAAVKRQTVTFKRIQYLVLNLILLNVLLYETPLPSPYMLLYAPLSLLTYFELGVFVAACNTAIAFVLLTVDYFQRYSVHNHELLSVYFVTYAMISVLIYYDASFLKLIRKELTDVEKSYGIATANEQQVQSLINNIGDGVIAIDEHQKIAIYNAAALDVLDMNAAILGQKIESVFKPVDAEKKPVDITKLLAGIAAPTTNRDLRLNYEDGSTANIFLGIAPIYLGYGKSKNNGYTLILRDITREKSLEEERDEFISVVSHELRTPIAITEGNISNAEFVAEKTGDMDVIRKTLKESHNQVIFLADMINDLSTLSRAERGKLELDIEAINIHDLVMELAANYKPQAENKKLVIKTDVHDSIPDLESSKLYVREILQNFITNAIKYTETGSVTIKATANPKGVDFAVIDTGIGISKSDQNKVFDKFFRSEDYRTRANGGTGLGLYVTMKLVRLIHADIGLTSELNKGSTFSIFIPNIKK